MIRVADLSPERRTAVQAALVPGEVVRWIGLPDPSKSPGGSGQGFTPAYVWLGIVGVWQAGALTAALASGLAVAWYYVAVGCVFMALGGLFYRRALVEHRAAQARLHLVTDRRLLTIDLADLRASLALSPAEIAYAEPTVGRQGHGDIEIGHGEPGTLAWDIEMFHHIRGVGDVEAAIKALRRLLAEHGRVLATVAPDDDD